MKHFFYILALFSGFQTFSQETLDAILAKFNNETVPYISVELLQTKMQSGGVILLDARENEEFAVSRIANAIWVGFDNFSLEKTIEQLPNKNADIVVYCSLGVRSEKIGEQLLKAGFTNVRNLFGGIFEWKNKGNPVYDTGGNETEKVHAHSKRWGVWLKKGEKVY